MKVQRWFVRTAAAALLAIGMLPAAAGADVTVERFTKGTGIAGIGGHEATTTEKISGLRKRDVTQMKMSGGLGSFLNKFTGDRGTDTIIDVKKDTVWQIDHQAKTYTERRIVPPQTPEEMGGPGGPGGRGGEEREAREAPEEESKVKVIRNEITVDETGEKKTIGEFDTERYVVTWILETENLETKERGEMRMVTDLWTTRETKAIKALKDEETKFAKAYLKKMGWDMSDQQSQKFGMAAIAGMVGGDQENLEKGMKEVAKKLEKIKGYPVGTKVAWHVKQSGGEGGKEGMSSQGGLPDLGKGLDSLMGRFGKKKKKAGGDGGASAPAPAGGERPVFESYSEIRRVSTDGISDGEFQPPAGYGKASE